MLSALVPAALRPRLRSILVRKRRMVALAAAANPLLSPDHRMARRRAWTLLDHGDALGAYALVTGVGTSGVDAGTRRQLWYDLEQQGYLGRALGLADSCPTRSARDRRRRERLRGLVAVLSGQFVPSVPPPTAPYVPRPGRVLHVVKNSLPRTQAGYTLRTHYIAVAQAAAGLDPHVVTQMGFAADATTPEVVDGIAYHRIPGPDREATPLDTWLAAHVTGVADLVRRLRPAVLHAASDYVNALTALAVGRAYGIPVVYESRGFWEETWLSRQVHRYGWDLDRLAAEDELPDAYVLRRDLEDRCRRDADMVVTLSASMVDRVVAGGVPRERVVVVPNAVDTDAFPVLTRDRELAARLGIGAETTVIGYISSLNEYEGIDVLIDAYALVKAAWSSPVRLLIVGDGPYRDNLVRHAAARGLTDVVFAGRVPHADILTYYGLIDIFVIPRRPTGVAHLVTPLKPYEAFATGRTVVCANVRALAALAEESGAVELFEAGSEESLATVLLTLLADPDRRRRLADTGAAWVRSHASWAANAATYRGIYAALGAVTGTDRVDRRP
ncbi:MAG: glycosyltransferase [Micromonosporaceae bacterium]|nr:glycosyltransferase [Micromonosporaceae bacterium]